MKRKSIFDYEDGDFCNTISDNMAYDSDGNLMMRMSDHMAIDVESGDMHFMSGWSSDDDDED